MLRKALLGLVLTAGVAFAGEKGQAPKAQAPVPAKIVTQTVITKEYVPVEKRRKLLFRQLGSSKVETCTNCVDCPNCKK